MNTTFPTIQPLGGSSNSSTATSSPRQISFLLVTVIGIAIHFGLVFCFLSSTCLWRRERKAPSVERSLESQTISRTSTAYTAIRWSCPGQELEKPTVALPAVLVRVASTSSCGLSRFFRRTSQASSGAQTLSIGYPTLPECLTIPSIPLPSSVSTPPRRPPLFINTSASLVQTTSIPSLPNTPSSNDSPPAMPIPAHLLRPTPRRTTISISHPTQHDFLGCTPVYSSSPPPAYESSTDFSDVFYLDAILADMVSKTFSPGLDIYFDIQPSVEDHSPGQAKARRVSQGFVSSS